MSGLTDAQKEAVKQVITILSKNVQAKKIRIPSRVEAVSVKWVRDAPFFSEFLLRFNYFETEGVPTMGVDCRKGSINLYFNPKFVDGGMEYIKFDDKTGEAIVKKDKKGQPKLDKDGNVEYEKEMWKGLSDAELEGVLVHEIMHLIRMHHERSLEDRYIFNIAGDMIINNDLKTMKIANREMKLPKGCVYLDMARKDGYKGNPITEPLYYWLLDLRKKYENQMQDLMQQQGQGQGKQKKQCPSCGGDGKEKCKACGGDGKEKDSSGNPTGQPCLDCGGNGKEKCPSCGGSGKDQDGNQCPGCGGSGQKNCSDCGGSGKQKGGGGTGMFDAKYNSKIDVHDILDQSDGLTESVLKEIIETAKIRGWGSIAGDMVQKLEELTKPSQIPWQQVLRKFLSSLIHSPGPFYENSWARRNRRQLPLPGIKKLTNKIVVAVDTSGSIQTKELQAFFAEIEKIVKDRSQLLVLQNDTQIQDVWNDYKKGDWRRIKVKGRGGTIVQPVFDWMVEHKMDRMPLVYFTDGYFDHNFDVKNIKTIWCCTQEENKIPGGRNIYIKVE